MSPEKFAEFMASETTKWTQVVREAGLKVE